MAYSNDVPTFSHVRDFEGRTSSISSRLSSNRLMSWSLGNTFSCSFTIILTIRPGNGARTVQPFTLTCATFHGGERFLCFGLRDLEFEFTNGLVLSELEVVLVGLTFSPMLRLCARQFRLILRTVKGHQEGSFFKPLSLLEGQLADPALDLTG